SQLDRSAPPFEELQPIATEYGLPEDWTLPYEVPSDFGDRPDFEQLGPLHWNPPLAPKVGGSSRFDNDPRPLILIHFLGHACLHCTEQLNAIADRIDEFEKAGFKVLAISTDTNEDLRLSEENYAASRKPFPIQLIADPDLDYFRAYGAYDEFEDEPLHGTHLISPTGQILWSDISAEPFMDLDFLLKESRRLLEIHAR
ncbi:MAG: redoxin domain-containing protein, partial [Verrucomicrobiota bacterium]